MWALAAIPITLYPFLRESVYLVLLISLYANFVGHLSGYEAAKAKEIELAKEEREEQS